MFFFPFGPFMLIFYQVTLRSTLKKKSTVIKTFWKLWWIKKDDRVPCRKGRASPKMPNSFNSLCRGYGEARVVTVFILLCLFVSLCIPGTDSGGGGGVRTGRDGLYRQQFSNSLIRKDKSIHPRMTWLWQKMEGTCRFWQKDPSFCNSFMKYHRLIDEPGAVDYQSEATRRAWDLDPHSANKSDISELHKEFFFFQK